MPTIPEAPEAIRQALHLIATSPLRSNTQRAAVEVVGTWLRTDRPDPPHDEPTDELDALSVALKDELLATGASWAAMGISYVDMNIASIRNHEVSADAPQRPHSQAADASSESQSQQHRAPAQAPSPAS